MALGQIFRGNLDEERDQPGQFAPANHVRPQRGPVHRDSGLAISFIPRALDKVIDEAIEPYADPRA
jgi:hypothetical protein